MIILGLKQAFAIIKQWYIDRVHIGISYIKKKCIVISVYFDDIDNNPNIDAIGYDEDCNENRRFIAVSPKNITFGILFEYTPNAK